MSEQLTENLQEQADGSPIKQIVCLASTMRSGSTLLKALLAEANDVSNLPEINFQKYRKARVPDSTAARKSIEQLDQHRIVLLKRPAWYNETSSYPRLPNVDNLKVICLVRDVYDTVESCRKMTFSKVQKLASPLVDRRLAIKYWLPITQSLLDLHESSDIDTALVRYEDVVANPLTETKRLFEFVGSEQSKGVDSYGRPEDFKWRWGRDDGSPNIRSLKVQPPRQKTKNNLRLNQLIETTPEIIEQRQRIGFTISGSYSRAIP